MSVDKAIVGRAEPIRRRLDSKPSGFQTDVLRKHLNHVLRPLRRNSILIKGNNDDVGKIIKTLIHYFKNGSLLCNTYRT